MENVGGFMGKYILKFLGAAVSLNLFSIGIANSMMPTNKKVIDYSTGEEIPLGGIDKEEILSDGTKLIYVSQKNIESRREEIKKIIIRSIIKYDTEYGGLAGAAVIGLISKIAADKLDSNIPLVIGAIFGLPGIVDDVKALYFGATGRGRSRDRYVGRPLRGLGTANDYPYGLVLMKRPCNSVIYNIDDGVGVYYSCVYEQDHFYKDTLIQEIARGC